MGLLIMDVCLGPQVPLDQQCLYEGCNRRKYQEGVKVHDFCGKIHARLYKGPRLSKS